MGQMAQQNDLLRRFQQALGAGQEQTRGIYGQALQGARGLYGQASGLLEGLGQTARTRATRGHKEGVGGDTASLVGRGLYNTTALDSMRRVRDRDLEEQHQSIDEQVGAQRAGVLERQAGTETGIQLGQAGFEEGQLPQQGLIAQLMSQLGEAGQTGRGHLYTVAGATPSGGGGGSGGGGAGGAGGSGGGGYGGGGGGGGRPRSGVQTYTNPMAGRQPTTPQPPAEESGGSSGGGSVVGGQGPAPHGMEWRFNFLTGRWQLVSKGTPHI